MLEEIKYAINKGKIILPVVIDDDVRLSREMQNIRSTYPLFLPTYPVQKLFNILPEIMKYSQEIYKKIALKDIVECTVFSPPDIALETSILVQVFVHNFTDEESVKTIAKEFDKDAERRGFTTLTTKVTIESLLSFHLEIDELEILSPIKTLVWYGRPASVTFMVTAPKSALLGNHFGTVTISQNSVPIGHIQFKITVSVSFKKINEYKPEPTGDEAIPYKMAFIAYSSIDRVKVLDRIPMLDLQGIKYHQDLLSLRPGDFWEEKLTQYINECDLFLLFWSQAAKKSPYVRKEIKHALLRKGSDLKAPPKIVPVLIEGPPPVEPCEELKHIQFDDYLIYLKDFSR